MNALFSAEPLLYPSLSPATLGGIRILYGLLLLATLAALLPHARRYFLSERWGGYGQRHAAVDAVQNPVVMPVLLAAWFAAAVALVTGRGVVVAALVNVILCRYFFIQMRWRGVLRGMGAPGFITYWLGAAVLLLEATRRFAPESQGLALLVLQVDFAFIMLSAGLYKFRAGYRQNEGMELGMVNPEWGYWSRFWSQVSPRSWWFRIFNQTAWGTEVVAGALMVVPATRFAGGMLILASFIFIATQIRLGFLCEMVMVCCLLFAYPGSVVDGWLAAVVPVAFAPSTPAPAPLRTLLAIVLWGYLLILPFARAGLAYNFYRKKALPGASQRLLEAYTNFWGLIIWRVFSVDITNFFIQIYEQGSEGSRRLLSSWGRGLRFRQVAESITVTSLFTTLKYYPGQPELFRERLLRYARTLASAPGSLLVFSYLRVGKQPERFVFAPVAEYVVDVARGSVTERVLDPSFSVHAPASTSPIHEGARPGTYAPARP